MALPRSSARWAFKNPNSPKNQCDDRARAQPESNSKSGGLIGEIDHVVAAWNGVPREIEEIMTYGQSVNRLAEKADVIATGAYVSAIQPWTRAVKDGRMTWEQAAQLTPADVTKAMIESIDADLAPRLRSERAAAKAAVTDVASATSQA